MRQVDTGRDPPYSNLMNPPVIDTSSLLTMLGIIAAVWALIPSTARLTFRLSFSWFDWLVIWAGTLTIHVLVFEQVLRAVDAYPILGPWLWGFDKSGLLYLLFLGLAVYVYARARTTRLSPRSLPLFERLTTSLLHARKFDELGALLERHLEGVLNIATRQSVRNRLAAWLQPVDSMPSFTLVGRQLVEQPSPRPSWPARMVRGARASLARLAHPNESAKRRARSTARMLFASRSLVAYLSRAYPYLCLRAVERSQTLVDDFQDEFFEALLADESSIFYAELKNNQNLRQGHRLRIPAENRLLAFYLKDVAIAAKLGVYRSVGEAMLSRISFDRELVDRLNGPLVTYDEIGRHRCPISTGIHFFRVTVFEGIYQRVCDHLWLHYVTHFVDRILEHARDTQPEDDRTEFATPFCYLLYEIVDVTTDWIGEAVRVTEQGDVVAPNQVEGRHVYISFQAAEALGGVMQKILGSGKVPRRLKVELLSIVLRVYRDLQQTARLGPLARATAQGMVRPYGMRAPDDYLATLDQAYGDQDHVRRGETRDFEAAIRAELNSSGRW